MIHLFLCCALLSLFLGSTGTHAQTVKPGDLILPKKKIVRSKPLPPKDFKAAEIEKKALTAEDDTIVAYVNDEQLTAEVVNSNGYVEAVDEILMRQAVEKNVPLYTDEFQNIYQDEIRKIISELYLEQLFDERIEELDLESEFDSFAKTFVEEREAEFPVDIIVRQSEAEARALVRWVEQGYSFDETRKQYSELTDILKSSPMRARAYEMIARLTKKYQGILKPGEITQNPVKTEFGYAILQKSLLESNFKGRMLALKNQFLTRYNERFSDIISGELARKVKYKKFGLTAPSQLVKPDNKDKIFGRIPKRPKSFVITGDDIAHRYAKTALTNIGIPTYMQMRKIHRELSRNLLLYDAARDKINERDPRVIAYLDETIPKVRRTMYLDQTIREFDDLERLVNRKFIDVRAEFKPLHAYQVQEVASPSLSDARELIDKWKIDSFKNIRKLAFLSRDMTHFYAYDYIALEKKDDGSLAFTYPIDQERYGSEVLSMKKGDVVTNPTFHGGQWAAYKLIANEKGALPSKTTLRDALIYSLHAPMEGRILQDLRSKAKIELQPEFDPDHKKDKMKKTKTKTKKKKK